ncbi:hypothetical protein LSUE1_G005561 [Lachnellula suecica]|uniref:ATP-binding protein n=1 Tax=Lachnellula suecica TaxID=602035 RepID=A0A8T9CB45_9HELO|nr:hypothetical protein LSUE1_G005561 [Lachnellula suecica]
MDSPRKFLIQMAGAPGSGKSTLANLLAKSPIMEAVVVNHDLFRSFFLENDIAFDQAAKLAYRFHWTLAEDLIKQGRNVIIDSTCNYDEIIHSGSQLAHKYGYEWRYIECRVQDINLLDQRLHEREPMRSQRTGVDAPPADYNGPRDTESRRKLFMNWVENPCRPSGDVVLVNSTKTPEECLAYVLKSITHPMSAV